MVLSHDANRSASCHMLSGWMNRRRESVTASQIACHLRLIHRLWMPQSVELRGRVTPQENPYDAGQQQSPG